VVNPLRPRVRTLKSSVEELASVLLSAKKNTCDHKKNNSAATFQKKIFLINDIFHVPYQPSGTNKGLSHFLILAKKLN
jgi:hypothetical protein